MLSKELVLGWRGGSRSWQWCARLPSCTLVVVLLAGVWLGAGCATLGSGGDSQAQAPKLVLYQMGSLFPEYSEISMGQWSQLATSPKISLDKVYALIVLNRPEQALAAARRYLNRHPGDLDGMEALVNVLYARKNLALLVYHARHVLAQDPNRTHMWNVLGLAHVYTARTLADFREAEAYFAKALTQPESAAVAYLNLGFLHLEMGAVERAKHAFSEAEDACGGCVPSKLGLGITLRRQNLLKEAELYLRSALKAPMSHKARYKLYFHLALTLTEGEDRKGRQEAMDLLVEIVSELDERDELYIKSQAVINEIALNQDDSGGAATRGGL